MACLNRGALLTPFALRLSPSLSRAPNSTGYAANISISPKGHFALHGYSCQPDVAGVIAVLTPPINATTKYDIDESLIGEERRKGP